MKGDHLETPVIEPGADPPPRVYVSREETLFHAFGFLALIGLSAGVLWWILSRLACDEEGLCGLLCPGEGRLFAIALLAGAAGGLIHAATSFAAFAGNRTLFKSWLPWIYLRAPIGSLLASFVYFAYRAGIFGSGTTHTCKGVYVLALMSGLAGLFSKQATDKLADLVDTLFTPRTPPGRNDGLAGPSGPTRDRAPGAAAAADAFDDDIAAVQGRLIELGVLPAVGSQGGPSRSGFSDAPTREAIARFFRDAGVADEDVMAAFGDETAAGYWQQLRGLVERGVPES